MTNVKPNLVIKKTKKYRVRGASVHVRQLTVYVLKNLWHVMTFYQLLLSGFSKTFFTKRIWREKKDTKI